MSLAGEEALTNASSTALETTPPPPASSQTEKGEALARHSTAAAAAADVEGQLRLETVGKIVFCFFMIPVSIAIIAFAARELVRIFWSDHRNDLLVNGFGILISVGIWLRSAIAKFTFLARVTVSVETQQLITYVCLTHSSVIQGIDTVRVYHSGPRLTAEVNIVMDPENILAETHDVAEALQIKLESLSHAERACYMLTTRPPTSRNMPSGRIYRVFLRYC
ncbi:Putative cation efflux protein, cytoplasmic domain superfamily [Colletotrichum destructivum]|uniref:Cation efflux protein, cytoplasmic domain superfamily n=1 Tax=Colletotrichum destructivum TaxID=34406 RepID=A0AAX4J2V3_9PEZI|nr:Putative cation efflux protein, cytoplasmic domain superfamily [Colletotrichum destructivum]